jgi:hypothetical protein
LLSGFLSDLSEINRGKMSFLQASMHGVWIRRKSNLYQVTAWWSNFVHRGPKMGVSCKIQRQPPAYIFVSESLPQKPPADTMFMAAMTMALLWKIVEGFQSFVKKIRNFDPHFKNLYLATTWVWRAHIGLVWKLVSRATHSVLQNFWSDHLLEHSKAMNEPQKTFKWPWKIKVSPTSSKFCSCASLKTCDLQILGWP